MKKKVLIIGPNYYGYNESVQRAFEDLGWQTKVIDYYEVWPSKITNVFLYKVLPKIGVSYFVKKYYRLFNERILDSVKDFQPSLVFFIKGSYIEDRTLRIIKNTALTVLWMMDSIYRVKDAYNNLHYFDYKFMFEASDVERLKEENIDSIFLPMAADTNNYFPLSCSEKDIDLLFVGVLYQNRIEMLERLVKKFPNLNIQIYGKYTSIKKPLSFIKYYFMGMKKYFKNRYVSPKELNELYSRTKIALNIHHNQSKTGCNPRVFEILATNTFQVVDENPYIKENFVNKNLLASYSCEEELYEKIKYYLNNEEERIKIAQNGYNTIINNHTFIHRVQFILNFIFG